jgi:hypothetical protein
MELIQISTYGSPLFAVAAEVFIPNAVPVVNGYFLPIFAQPQKITGILGKAFPLIFRRAG